MRFLSLSLLAALAAAADAEVLTLMDGRKLTGVYDDQAEVLDMGVAKLPVKMGNIVSRAPGPKSSPKPDLLADVKPAKIDERDPMAVIGDFREKKGAAEAKVLEAQKEAVAARMELDKRFAVIFARYDLRQIDRNSAQGQQMMIVDSLNRILADAHALADDKALDDYLTTLPKEYRSWRGPGNRRSVTGNYGEEIVGQPQYLRLFTDLDVAELYKFSRKGMKLTELDSAVEYEKGQYKDWQDRRAQDKANDAALRQSQRQQPQAQPQGNPVTLGVPRTVNR